MDGVLCDFNSDFLKISPELSDKTRFATAVMKHKIFETLKPMPDALQLLHHVAKLRHINIEILTSVGTFDEERGLEAKKQKSYWLERNNIPHKANFVRCKAEKANYASSTSILIDDSSGCIAPFIKAGGHGILHTNSNDSITVLDNTLKHIEYEKSLRC